MVASPDDVVIFGRLLTAPITAATQMRITRALITRTRLTKDDAIMVPPVGLALIALLRE